MWEKTDTVKTDGQADCQVFRQRHRGRDGKQFIFLRALCGDFSQPFFKTPGASIGVTLVTAQNNPLSPLQVYSWQTKTHKDPQVYSSRHRHTYSSSRHTNLLQIHTRTRLCLSDTSVSYICDVQTQCIYLLFIHSHLDFDRHISADTQPFCHCWLADRVIMS